MNSLHRKWLIQFIIFGAIFITILSIVCYLAGTLLTAGAPAKIDSPPSDMHLENVEFRYIDKLYIRGWYCKGEMNRGAVVLIHGIRSNRLQMLNRAHFLQELGITVLLIDLQAHGESDGDKISFGFYEAQSVDAAIKYLRKRIPKEKIGVLGVSLGGAACLLGEKPVSADVIIIEEVYATVEEAVINRLTIRFGQFGRLGAPLLLYQIPLRLKISTTQLQPVEAVKNVHCPIFIIGGTEDKRTLVGETRRIYEVAPEPKELWLVEGATHVDLFDYAGVEYKRKIIAFLEKYLLN